MTLKMKVNKKLADKLLATLIKVYEDEARPPDKKWHVSELVFPRQTVARKLEVPGYETTPTDIGFFYLGKACHTELQRILGEENAEVRAEKHGVIATMDFKKGDTKGMEIKTSRKWTIPDEPEPHYIRQAGYYAEIHDLDQVDIVVIYPTAGRTWKGKKASTVEFKAWTVYFPPAAKKHILYDMERTKEAITKAVKAKSFKGLPPCPAWIVERYDGEVSDGGYKKAELEMKKHPFWYAWKEKHAL